MTRQTIIDNRYKPLEKLGSGAMGKVYKAEDLKDNRIIAFKILSKEKTSTEAVQHFKREFKLLSELRHPNLCAVYDFGMLKDGRSYFTMEYVGGKNMFEASRDLPYKKLYPLIVQLCRALQYIHARGLIHYDIKPSNVLVAKSAERRAAGEEYTVKLMDFGLAGEQLIKGCKLVKGTLPYIAPEVIEGLNVDHRADLYSLGVLLYEILSKKRLEATGETSFATLIKQETERVSTPSKIMPGISKGLRRLLLKLLEVEPADRFSRANDVIREMNKIAGKRFEIETEKTLEGYLLSSKFVGREKEMVSLKSLYADAKQGKGRVVLITGDAGIGKSRLLREFKTFIQLERGHCLIGNIYKDKTRPLGPFHDIFNVLIHYLGDGSALPHAQEIRLSLAVLFKMFPGLATSDLRKHIPELVALEPEAERLRTFEGLTELISYVALSLGELVILLEDLHWADDLSIQFLEYLGHNLEGKNILVCSTAREGTLLANVVLKKTITDLKHDGYLPELKLLPLGYKDLYSFIDSTITTKSNSPTLTQYLLAKTGGNPFLVEEIMRTFLRRKGVSIGQRVEIEDFKKMSIPTAVPGMVLKTLVDLDANSQMILSFAAVLLGDFNYDLIQGLTNLDDTGLSKALWTLKRRQVLVEVNNRFQFRHPSLREAVNRRLGDKERRDLNYRTGRVLENINRGKLADVVEDLAHYFINARHYRKGLLYGRKAAQKSSEKYDYTLAISFYKGTLKLLRNKDRVLRFCVLQNLARIESLVGGFYDDAIRHYCKALNTKVGSIKERITINLGIASIYQRTAESSRALHVYRTVISLLNNLKQRRLKHLLEVNVEAKMCYNYLMLDDYKRAKAFKFDELQLADGLKGQEALRLLANTYQTIGIVESLKSDYGYSNVGYERAVFCFKRAHNYHKHIGNENAMGANLMNLGVSYRNKWDFRKAFSCYQKAAQLVERTRDLYRICINYCNLGHLLAFRGDYAKALDYLRKAIVISDKIGNRALAYNPHLEAGECFLKLSHYTQAREYLGKALKALDAIGRRQRGTDAIADLAESHKCTGDITLAIRLYRIALKNAKVIEHRRHIAYLLCEFSSIFVEIGKFSTAERYIGEAQRTADALGSANVNMRCNIRLSNINVIVSDYVAAESYYRMAMKTACKFGLRGELLYLRLLRSAILYGAKKYLKGMSIASMAIRMAKKMGTKDLYVEALLLKVKNGLKLGVFSTPETTQMLDEAKKIAKEIGNVEVLWKTYFEYGQFLYENKDYKKGLEHFRKCLLVFKEVTSKIKNKRYQQSYINRPDRKEALVVINQALSHKS